MESPLWQWDGKSGSLSREVWTVSVSYQLPISTYYRPLEYGDVLRKCLVVSHKCVVSERPFLQCIVWLCNRFVLTMDLICRTSACASDSQKTDFDQSYHLSKTAEKGSSSYAGTPRNSSAILPISLAMAKVYPAESAISLLAAICCYLFCGNDLVVYQGRCGCTISVSQ